MTSMRALELSSLKNIQTTSKDRCSHWIKTRKHKKRQNIMSDSNQPSLVGGHAQYVKGGFQGYIIFQTSS